MDFNHLFKRLAEEWERTLMSVVMIGLLAYLSFVAYNMLTEDEGSSQNTVKPKAPHRFFDTTNTAYIEPAHLLPSINPFNFHIKISLPTPPQPTPKPTPQNNQNVKPQGNKNTQPQKQEPSKNPPKDNKQEDKKPPKQDAKQDQKQQPAKPQPPKHVRKIAVQYRGFLKGTEEQIAFYSALDSQGKKTEAKSAKEGAKIHGILQIKSFDADKLVVVLGDKDVVVKRGKKQEFIIQ
ncbi:MAG: hypothetical protein IKP00_02570 [Victivallales bacterium]|nr:hypothetical protein [Victivallales bacterium]